jgi:hypothetical protein
MRCHKPDFPNRDFPIENTVDAERPEFPDRLTDYLTGGEIPFSNRDNIRQKILRFLIEGKGYLKDDISTDRKIRFDIEGTETSSMVDISIRLDNKTLIVGKCSSGSLVSRERQIIAAARLLENYLVPFAVVTNGKDLELLDSDSERVIGEGFGSLPSRQDLLKICRGLSFKPTNKKKIIYEQRILFTYDAISCPVNCKIDP